MSMRRSIADIWPWRSRSWRDFAATLALVGILAVGAGLRLFRLDGALLYSDQAFCWRVACCGWSELIERAAGDTHPPGYFMLLKAWISVCGDSVAALRLPSAVLGTACIWAMYWLVLELLAAGGPTTSRQRAGALAAAALMAVHYVPVEASRIARMYPLGLLMTLASSWTLLRALRERDRPYRWWCAYGLAVVGLLYCHNYAQFTVAAQAFFLAIVWTARYCKREVRWPTILTGPMLAALFVVVGYTPWLPRFLEQASRVRTRFWIPPLRAETVETTFLSWFSGIGYWDGMAFLSSSDLIFRTLASLTWLYLLVAEALLLWCAFRLGSNGCLPIVLTVIPWTLAIGISLWSGRPILQPRYLTFAEVGPFAAFGVAVGTLPKRWPGMLLAAAMLLLAAYGTWTHAIRFPQGPPAIDAATEYLAEHLRAGDAVVVSRPKRLLELRYYLHRHGLDRPDVRCPIDLRPDGGHTNLVAGLTSDDALWPVPPGDVRRIWLAAEDDGYQVSGWTPMGQSAWREETSTTWRVSDDWEEPSYTLRLLVRAADDTMTEDVNRNDPRAEQP